MRSTEYTITLNGDELATVGGAEVSRMLREGRAPDAPAGTVVTRVDPQRVPGDPVDAPAEPPPAEGGGELQRLHQMMRGRYLLAVLLAVLLGAGGGYLGFRSGTKVYASTGTIRVMPVLPTILYPTEEKGALPMFDSFVDAQAALIKSQSTIDMAMQDPAWAALGRGRSDQATEAYMHAVNVAKEGDIIQVQAVDPDPTAAMTEVRTLIKAYQTIYNTEDALSGERRLGELETLQTNKSAELVALRKRILELAQQYGSDDLRGLYEFYQGETNKLDARIAEKQMDLSEATQSVTGPAGGDLPKEPTPEEWARYSAEMNNELTERNGLRKTIKQMTATGSLPADPAVLQRQRLLDLADEDVRQLALDLQRKRAAGWVPTQLALNLAANGSGPDVAALREELELLKAQRDKMQAQTREIGKKELDIKELQNQSDEVRRDRDDAQQRMKQLNLEAKISTRIQVISDGDRPLGSFKDTHVAFAALGGMGGALAGFGMVAGLAALDSRVRSPEAAGAAVTVLGMLPYLPGDLFDAVQAASAAHCVNKVRTSLQLWGRHSRHRVFAITSPEAGSGKTSLTLALGLSYATARLRTLIVDCDLVGSGLTSRIDQIVTRRLGEVLRGQGLVTDGQLARALDRSKATGQRLGEVLVELGLVAEADVAHAVALQASQQIGILDALHGMPLSQCVADSGVPNLQFLPVGAATARDVPLLTSHDMQALIEVLARAYDVVLIDTGPILGSLEAQLVSALADGVIMTVTKGARRPVVARSMSQLAQVGARVAGVVFNRASPNDITMYDMAYSRVGSSSRPAPSGVMKPLTPDAGRAAKFGPLAVAVAQSAPIKQPE